MSISNIFKKLNSQETQLFPKIPKINKFASILVAFVFLAFLSRQILAITSNASLSSETVNAFIKKQTALTSGNNQETWLSDALNSNVMTFTNILIGDIPENVLNGTDTSDTSWIPGGLIGITNQNIGYLYQPPFSGVQYIAQTINNFFNKPIYASTGYEELSSLLPLWKGFRNVTYAIFSLVFIIIGIMIMLRVKISQQAVVTIQSAIPKLITSLILVTFSYAIAGLLIDMSYLVEGLGISIIYQASNNNSSVSSIIQDPGLWTRLWGLLPMGIIITLSSIISFIIGGLVAKVTLIPVLGGFVGIGTFVVIMLILAIIITWYMGKFFIGLVKCYITIILKTIIGPLEIALGAIPNMKMGFGTWFTDIIANVLVFPISVIFLVLVEAIIKATSYKTIWMPPGIAGLNTLTYISGGIFPVLLAISSLVLVSKLPQLVPELIFQIKPSPWGKAIGEGLSPYSKSLSGAAGFAGRGALEKGGQFAQERGAAPGASRLWKNLGTVADTLQGMGKIKGWKKP